MQSPREFIIVGAGPVGLSVSMLLLKKGHSVKIFDKRKDPRYNTESGRSINLALSHRGFQTLELLGLESKIKSNFAVEMPGRMIHDETGETNFQPYSIDNECIYSVSRGELNNLLIEEAKLLGIEIRFECKCLDYDVKNEKLLFENFELATVGKLILGCDGAFSPLRNVLKKSAHFKFLETKLDYGYQEFSIQAGNEKNWKLTKNALHIWPRKDFMLIALPNIDGSFTCTLFLRLKGEHSFELINNQDIAIKFFEEYFSDAFQLMNNFNFELETNPVSTLFMENCSPWNIDDKLLLLGDAAHAIVPFYGQGLNAGLEDARLLVEQFDNENSENLFTEFQKKRKPDTDAISELALQNFTEMRDLVTDPTFLKKKKIESKIKNLFPQNWKTLYELVTFSDIPYSKAKKTGIENDSKVSLILQNEMLSNNLLSNELNNEDLQILKSIVM